MQVKSIAECSYGFSYDQGTEWGIFVWIAKISKIFWVLEIPDIVWGEG